MSHSDSQVKVAIVGLGRFAHELAAACQASERLTIASCFTRNRENARAFARKYGCATAPSFAALLEDPAIEAVILVTPNDLHCEQTIAMARAGKHVFVEKPICNRLEEADWMIDACAQAGVLLAVGHQERRHSAYRYMKKILVDGVLGRVRAFEANHCGNLLAVWPQDDWRFSSQGGGPILHKGIHKIDILNYLFGDVEAVATLGCDLPFNPRMHATTVSAIRYADGIVGSLSSGFAHTNTALNIYGDRRSMMYSGFGSCVQVKDEKTWDFETIDCGPDRPLVEELLEFAEAVRGRGRIEVDGQVARKAVELATVLGQSARENRTVFLGETRRVESSRR